ncbi:DUF3231 family protein [Halanaerobaculum tunisiense]
MKLSNLLHPKRLFKKNITVEDEASTIEAHNLWNSLRSRYISIETYKFYRNFVHDRDFDLLLDDHIENFQEQINILEKTAEKLKVKVPSKPPEQIKTSTHIDAITDKIIFKRIYSDLISELYLLSGTISRSRVNDGLRKHFITFVGSHLKDFQNLYKYGKLKGWTEVAPAFKTHKPVSKEELSSAEAGHLWELLNLRYDQLQLTRIFLDFVHDQDLKIILQRGTSKLQKQIKKLEEKASEFELPLPEKPPASQQAKIDSEMMEDKFIYRIILKGSQDAIDTHIRAVVETIRNDNIRDLFFQLYNEEVELYDDIIRYGKIKGWSYISPKYRKS